MKTLSEQILDVLRYGVREYGSAAALCRATGVSPVNMSRWLKGVLPKTSEIEPVFNLLKVSLSVPDVITPTTQVQFVSPHVVPAGNDAPPPEADKYLAIPVVDEIHASHGPVSPIDIKSWFMVRKDSTTLKYKKDLIAVVKDGEYNIQEPTLRAGDICIVDRDDIQPDKGAFMLVRTPPTRQGLVGQKGMLCRVYDNGDELVFDSDCKGTRPHLYSIEKEYGGDVRKALIGKVLFCWSDMQGR